MPLNVGDEKPDGWNDVAKRLERVETPAPLTDRQLARIARRVFDARDAARRPGWIAAAIALGAVAAAIVIVRMAGSRTVASPPIAPPRQTLKTPAPIVESARLAVLDTGVVVPVNGSGTVVREGRVAIRTAEGMLTVDVPDGRVTVAPHSLVEIDVRHFSTKVASYRGQATFTTSERDVLIPAGRERESTGAMAEAGNDALLLDRALDLGARAPVKPTPISPRGLREPAQPHAAVATTTVESVSTTVSPPAAGLGEESDLVAAALRKVNEHDAPAALRFADEHAMRFPAGALRGEMSLVRAEALAQLGRTRESAAALDRATSQGAGLADRVAVLRGELRAASGDCAAALADFALAVASSDGEVASRARFDRGACRARLGDRQGARDDLKRYLESHPNGPNAAAARRALGD